MGRSHVYTGSSHHGSISHHSSQNPSRYPDGSDRPQLLMQHFYCLLLLLLLLLRRSHSRATNRGRRAATHPTHPELDPSKDLSPKIISKISLQQMLKRSLSLSLSLFGYLSVERAEHLFFEQLSVSFLSLVSIASILSSLRCHYLTDDLVQTVVHPTTIRPKIRPKSDRKSDQNRPN